MTVFSRGYGFISKSGPINALLFVSLGYKDYHAQKEVEHSDVMSIHGYDDSFFYSFAFASVPLVPLAEGCCKAGSAGRSFPKKSLV